MTMSKESLRPLTFLRLFDHLLDQLTAQWGDDAARDDEMEMELQELRNLIDVHREWSAWREAAARVIAGRSSLLIFRRKFHRAVSESAAGDL